MGVKWIQAVGKAERLSEKDSVCEKLQGRTYKFGSEEEEGGNWCEWKLGLCEYLM